MASEPPIDVLVVDDSAVARGMIARGLIVDDSIRVIATAGDGQSALQSLENHAPHVVVLDVEMPVMTGLEALPRILAKRPGTIVIMASALTRRHAAMSLRALELGASDYVPKPDAAGGAGAPLLFLEELRSKIKALAHARPRVRAPSSTLRPLPLSLKLFKPAAVAIGSSTGGPPALLKLFSGLSAPLKAPVFITQHMPPTFTAMLAEQLGNASGAPAFEGADGMKVQTGAIYVAPGGKHMLAERVGQDVIIRLSERAPENFVRPSVDPMLRSLAEVYGATLLAIILTGMGRDGADGCLAVDKKGGRFVAQDEATSVVYGMPAAAFKTGRAAAELSLDEISALVAQNVGRAL